MRFRAVVSILVFSVVGLGQDRIGRPLLGWMRDRAQLRAVYGVAGNFLAAPAIADGVLAAGFSGSAGAIKTDSAVILLDAMGQASRQLPAPPGPALFAFDRAGQAAWCYFPETKQLQRLTRATSSAVDLGGLDGVVLALGASIDGLAQLLVARDAALWKVAVAAEGQVVSEEILPGLPATGPVIVPAADTVVVADGDALIIRRDTSGDQRVTLPALATDLELLGDGWIRVGQPDGPAPLALRLVESGPSLYRLPASEAQP